MRQLGDVQPSGKSLSCLLQIVCDHKFYSQKVYFVSGAEFGQLGFQLGLLMTTMVFPANLPTSELSNSPMLVSEKELALFNFYLGDTVLEGMRYHNELYGLVCQVNAQEQVEAYSLACALNLQSGPVVVSTNVQHYKVWISLRSPAYPVPQSYAAEVELTSCR